MDSVRDIDAVVVGSAPDAFDGYHNKGQAVVEATGGLDKPFSRISSAVGRVLVSL